MFAICPGGVRSAAVAATWAVPGDDTGFATQSILDRPPFRTGQPQPRHDKDNDGTSAAVTVRPVARLTPSRVRGLVLLDPVHPDNVRLRQELPGELFRRSGSDLGPRLRTACLLARLRLGVVLRPLLMKSPPLSHCRDHPAQAIDSIWRHMKRARTYETALSEYAELESHTKP